MAGSAHAKKMKKKYLLAHLAFILALLRSMGYTVEKGSNQHKGKGSKKAKKKGSKRRSHKQVLATKKLIRWNKSHPHRHRKKKA